MASLVSKRVIVLKPENVAQLVFFIRGEKVMFDADLAMLYGVEVRSLNQAVARNRKRFPADFAFQLTDDELAALRSQIVTSNTGRGGRRYLPYAFTEQGVAMLSSVLRESLWKQPPPVVYNPNVPIETFDFITPRSPKAAAGSRKVSTSINATASHAKSAGNSSTD